MRGLLQHWTESSIILTSKEESVWRNKKPRSRTVSFAEDRLLTWSTSTSGSLEPTDSVENYTDLFKIASSKWWYSGNRFEMGWNFIINDENPIWWHLGRIVHIKNSRVWEIKDRIGIVRPGDSSEESRTWLSQIENDGKKKYLSKIYETGILGPETEIMKETPWLRIRGENRVDIEFLEIVGSGKPTGSVPKETTAVSVTMSINVQKWHSRISAILIQPSPHAHSTDWRHPTSTSHNAGPFSALAQPDTELFEDHSSFVQLTDHQVSLRRPVTQGPHAPAAFFWEWPQPYRWRRAWQTPIPPVLGTFEISVALPFLCVAWFVVNFSVWAHVFSFSLVACPQASTTSRSRDLQWAAADVPDVSSPVLIEFRCISRTVLASVVASLFPGRYVLERWIRAQRQTLFGKNSWVGSKIHHNTELWTQLTRNRWNSSGISSQDSLHCSSSTKSKRSCQKWATQNNSKDELSSRRCSMTSCGELKTMNRNVLPIPHLCLYLQKDFQQDVGHSSDLDQKQSGILPTTKDHKENGTESLDWWWISEDTPPGEWDKLTEKMMVTFAESGHPVFRATSPLSRGTLKSKGGGKLSIHYCADVDTIETVFRTIISVHQLSIYGAVSDLCEEYESFYDRTGNQLWEGSRVPHSRQAWSRQTCFWIMMIMLTKIFNCKDTENKLKSFHNKTDWPNFVWMQDSWMLLKSDSISWRKIFLNVVEIGQYFMTKDTAEFSQFTDSVACREYTLPRNEETSEPKGWIRGNTKIGPVLEVTTCCLQGKYGVEIRIMSITEDNSHSWVRVEQRQGDLFWLDNLTHFSRQQTYW